MSRGIDTDAMTAVSGRVIDGRYALLRVIGEGGLGRVYAAMDKRLGREVALKVLLAQHAETTSLRARFEREARVLSALAHPNIVSITDFGLDAGRAFVVMELLPGQDLARVLAGERLEPVRAVAIIRGVLSALAYAHAQQIVHRDLKPSNVIVRPLPDGTDHVAVLDFGLAKFLEDDVATGAEDESAPLTRSGAVVGTPAYMSPEQACGVPVDARSDVYSAGLLLFELLAGHRPFADTSGAELLKRRLVEPPPSLSQVAPQLAAPAALQDVLVRALQPETDARFAHAGEMLRALDALPAPFGRVSLPDATPSRVPLSPMSRASGLAPEGSPPVSNYASQVAALGAPSRAGGGRSWGPLVALVGVAGAGLALLVLAVGAWFMLAEEDAPAPVVSSGPTTVTPPPPARPSRPPARNPWLTAPRQEEVVSGVQERLDRGGDPSRRALRRLAAYAGNHPADPLCRLVLARAYTDQGWLSDAVPAWQEVLRSDPSLRGDPHVMPSLLSMISSNTHHETTADLIVEIYGREAIGPVDVAVTSERRERVRERLVALRTRLLSAI